jgi:hypothetical protein
MNTVIMFLGFLIIDINAWGVPTHEYLLIQVGALILYVAGLLR